MLARERGLGPAIRRAGLVEVRVGLASMRMRAGGRARGGWQACAWGRPAQAWGLGERAGMHMRAGWRAR